MKNTLRISLAITLFITSWSVAQGMHAKHMLAKAPVLPEDIAHKAALVEEILAETPEVSVGDAEGAESGPQKGEDLAVATPKDEPVAKFAPKQSASEKLASKIAPPRVAAYVAPSRYGSLSIPSIGLNKAIGAVGLTSTGNMDVLDDPQRVGWYRGGTVPGNVGSAVIGAHVYQAFANLKNVNVGDAIYVEQANGTKLKFLVRETKVYEYTDPAPLQKIFNRADTARLNLITCYGSLTAGGSTYTHRLVVYAILAG